jgi:hypothetical protein
MPINKDLSVSPYFDDFDDEKNFYKILFKPGVAVQVRELNQLQTILQDQIEKFGNNIFKRGTIIDGVNFIYYPDYSYIKIKDSQLDGVSAVPTLYQGNFVVDPTSNLTAHVINSVDGFESTDPNLKTLYLRYINSGNDGNQTQFSPASILTVYDYLDSMSKVVVNNGSSGFSNTDSVVFCSAIEINRTSNVNFTVGETISQSGNTNFAIITEVTTVKDVSVLKIRPRQSDLTNTEISSTIWTFTSGADIIGSTSGAVATVANTIGTGAVGKITTSADIGKIVNVDVTARGEGYYVAPYVTIKSSGTQSNVGARNYNDLNLVGRNFIAQITVASVANSVGKGYAFGVTEGVIYQKGYFSRVEPQTVIVDKYSPSPDAIAVGFDTREDIIDYNEDQDLLDNASGTRNQFAPGADRLKLTPFLTVIPSEDAEANNEFLAIVEFSEGRAFRENKSTQFNSVMDELALRTKEQAGNFVLNKFLVTTRSTANQANEGSKLSVVVDPGSGYINGYRVNTKANFVQDIDKGIDTKSNSNVSSSINYGNYVIVSNYGGQFSVGETVNLGVAAVQYLANTTAIAAGTIPTVSNTIGTAKVRTYIHENGVPGTKEATGRLYLYDIAMQAGRTFAETRVFRNNNGIADVVTELDATLNASVCKLKETNLGGSLIVRTASDSTRNISNLEYVYRSQAKNATLANTGVLSVLLSDPNETFGYTSSTLTDAERRSITLAPTSEDIVLANSSGTVAVTAASPNATPSNVSEINNYNIGDFVAIYTSGSSYIYRRIIDKTSTVLILDSNASVTGSQNFAKVFPRNVSVPLDRFTTATLTGGNKTLNINFGGALPTSNNITCRITHDVKVSGDAAESKTANRDLFVKLNLATNTGGLLGPWCLGVADVFRLKSVTRGTDTNTFTTDITDQFLVDHNQKDDAYGLSYLYLKNNSNIVLTSSDWLLVKFDAFTAAGGVYTINSYVSANTAQRFTDDSLTLDNLGTKVNSFEIPELFSRSGYYDLSNCIDFRPRAANTAVLATISSSATVNPSATETMTASIEGSPLPESGVLYDIDSFRGRKDMVVISNDNTIKVVRGAPADNTPYPTPRQPENTLLLNSVVIPPYPCLGQRVSSSTSAILNTRMMTEKLLQRRVRERTVQNELDGNNIELSQPRAYTMSDISRLERRISDLEYNVQLSTVEADLKDRVIPSSISPDINRFKFGFFVDDYSTDKNSDVNHAEYQASVIGSRVVPISETSSITHGNTYRIGEFQSEFALVRQDLASAVPAPVVPVTPPAEQPPVIITPTPTEPPSPVLPPPVITPPTAPPQTTIITSVPRSAFRSYRNSTFKKSDIFTITAGTLPGTISIAYYFYGDADWLNVTKNGVVLYNQKIKNRGTVNIPHDPSTGREYVITVRESSPKWEYTVTWPVDSTSVVDTLPPSTIINTTDFIGHVTNITPGYLTAASIDQNFGTIAAVTSGSTVRVTVVGLKPNTNHLVSSPDSAVQVSIVSVLSDATGTIVDNGANNTIRTNQFGIAIFDMVVTPSQTSSGGRTPVLSDSNISYGQLPELALITMASTDNTSRLNFYIRTTEPAPPITNTVTGPQYLFLSDGSSTRDTFSPVDISLF